MASQRATATRCRARVLLQNANMHCVTASLRSKALGDFFVHYLGSLTSHPIVVVVGRNNLKKRSTSIELLLRELHKNGFSVCWYECLGARYAKQRQRELEAVGNAWLNAFVVRYPVMGMLATKGVRLCLKLKYPKKRWFLFRKWSDISDPSLNLRRFLGQLSAPEVILLSHSAGGIAASMAASEKSVSKIVCFGYPFKHPEKVDEDHRTAHLKTVSKPFLIVQGSQDEYGTVQDAQRYALSPQIVLNAIDSDHDYDSLESPIFDQMLQLVLQFLRPKQSV